VGGTYVGTLSRHDPMRDFLARITHDQLGLRVARPSFRVFQLRASNEVYAYEEKSSGARVICKFYGPKFGWDHDKAASVARTEYDSLETLRRYGLVGSPHHVIRPLGLDRDINGVLALEYYPGEQFSHAISRSVHRGDDAHLFWRLKALAYFLATQHNRTVSDDTIDFDADSQYLDRLLRSLLRRGRAGQWDVDELGWLGDLWRDRPKMWRDRQVLLHGDATPANFLFGHGLDVAAIDLERMKRGDRLFDVGRIAGELQHAFMLATGDRHRAEPFIGHFLWEYSCHFPDRQATFESISGRAPYYMGLNLLRIARNDYISPHHGAALVAQAKRLLQAN
jgi:hypothetical protein